MWQPQRAMQRKTGAKYWELIAADLNANGWSYGYFSMVAPSGQTLWTVDAHCGDGKRYIVKADELLTAFLELEAQTRKRRFD